MEQLFQCLSPRKSVPKVDTKSLVQFSLEVDMTHLAPLVAFPTTSRHKQLGAANTSERSEDRAVVPTEQTETADNGVKGEIWMKQEPVEEDGIAEYIPPDCSSDHEMLDLDSQVFVKTEMMSVESEKPEVKTEFDCCCENMKTKLSENTDTSDKTEVERESRQPESRQPEILLDIPLSKPQKMNSDNLTAYTERTLIIPSLDTDPSSQCPSSEYTSSQDPSSSSPLLPSHSSSLELSTMENPVLPAVYLYLQNKWRQLEFHLTHTNFHPSYHPKLQELWYLNLYEEWRVTRGIDSLTPPQKYRIRSRNPLPASLASVKFKSNNMYDRETRRNLDKFYDRGQYPDRGWNKIEDIMKETGLTAHQVRNYFKNKRSRTAK